VEGFIVIFDIIFCLMCKFIIRDQEDNVESHGKKAKKQRERTSRSSSRSRFFLNFIMGS
jgi:hypothetical protein